MSPPETDGSERGGRRGLALFSVWAAIAAALLLYSQTSAFAWDESFHLLAAQLIRQGKRPYLDFCFPQAPLNAYWNAGWSWLFGATWRTAHVSAALFTAGAAILASDFVFTHFPVRNWRVAAAATAVCVTGLNVAVFEYGPLGQAYGVCLFTSVAAFRLAVLAVDRKTWLAAAAGFFAGVAAASSLLTVTVAPVLAIWMLRYNRSGRRSAKIAAFAAGTAVPFAPVFWLFAIAPRQVWFNLVEYHTAFRRLYWPDATQHDLEVMTSWLNCGQALLLGLLALGGILFLVFRNPWSEAVRAQFALCGWLAFGIAVELSAAHPTFSRYYLLTVPFLAMLTPVGLYALASGTVGPNRPFWPTLVLISLTAMGLAKVLHETRDTAATWADYEPLARKVDEVTAPQGSLYADEPIYFLTHRTPPSGMEFSYSHKIELPPARMAALHIVTKAELDRRVKAGWFDTAVSCDTDDTDALGLKQLYRRDAAVADCAVFWDLKR